MPFTFRKQGKSSLAKGPGVMSGFPVICQNIPCDKAREIRLKVEGEHFYFCEQHAAIREQHFRDQHIPYTRLVLPADTPGRAK